MDTTRQEVCLFLAKENFLRSLIGNKLTLSVFVSMLYKDRKKSGQTKNKEIFNV